MSEAFRPRIMPCYTAGMLTLYDYLPSGNGYKVRLLLSQLGIRFRLVETDILKGETRTPEFRAINPNGRIPVLELEDGRRLAESDALLVHLAERPRLAGQGRRGAGTRADHAAAVRVSAVAGCDGFTRPRRRPPLGPDLRRERGPSAPAPDSARGRTGACSTNSVPYCPTSCS